MKKVINPKKGRKTENLRKTENVRQVKTQNNMVDFKPNILLFTLSVNGLTSLVKIQYCQTVF